MGPLPVGLPFAVAAHNQMNLSPIKSEAKAKPGAGGASVTVKSLSGIVPPMITPLRDRDALDIAGLEVPQELNPSRITHCLPGNVP